MFLQNRPDEESLPKAYETYYTHSARDAASAGSSRGLIAACVNAYLNYRFLLSRSPSLFAGGIAMAALPPLAFQLNAYGRHVPRSAIRRSASLLDVGCGNGDYLEIAKEMGLQAKGCEPDAKAVAVCRSRSLDVVHGDINAVRNEASFDIITMNHVIEHVEKPQELLRGAYELLRPGGRLWLGLPNPQAPGIRFFGASWKGFHPPFHLVIPSQRVLRDWLTDCGFKNVRALRRGMQSRGLWAESMRIYRRDGGELPDLILHLIKMACDLGATVCPVWSEETVIIADKPATEA